MALVRPLKLADEIKVAADCLEGAGGIFTATHLIALIQKRASGGLMLPSAATAKETAAAVVYRHTNRPRSVWRIQLVNTAITNTFTQI